MDNEETTTEAAAEVTEEPAAEAEEKANVIHFRLKDTQLPHD